MTDINMLEKSKKIKFLIERLIPENYEDYDVGDVVDDMRVVVCPVCGKKTLDEWHICSGCGWEYDYTSNYEDFSDANGSTLNEYIMAYNCVVAGDVK